MTSAWSEDPESAQADESRFDGAWTRPLALTAGGEALGVPGDDAFGGPFWHRYAPIALGRARPAFVVGQLGQSLDGRVATATGRSHYVNGPESLHHLHRLRALVDAVVVGIGTVLADDPQLTVRRVEGPNPARIVIDPNGRLPANSRILAADGAPVHAVQAHEQDRPEGVEPITLPSRDGKLAPADIVAALAERGYRRLLIEGGAGTVSGFLAAGAIHRLHICVAPILIGSGPIGVSLPPIDGLEAAVRPRTAIHRLGRDILFDCDLTIRR